MLIIILVIALGIVTGLILKQRISGAISRIITVLIWLLLFILGAEAGGNDELVSGITTLGFEALVITVGAVLGSVVFSWILWRCIIVHNRRKGGAE